MTKFSFGVTSQCDDGNHVYMADIDENISHENVLDIVCSIIENYHLYMIHIIKSTHGYNLMSFDKLPLKLIYEINRRYPSIDQTYNELQYYKRGFYTLRIADDKTYVNHLGCSTPLYMQSNAHRIFMNSIFNHNFSKNPYFDDFETFRIIRFYNQKHGVNFNDTSKL